MFKQLSSVFLSGLIILLSCLPLLAAHSSGVNNEHAERIDALVKYFHSEGLDIEELLEDSRFELYEKIGDRFTNSAEKRTLNLEEYKNVLGFSHKRDLMAGFIEENRDQLEKAEKEYDISKYVIAAIIGIESDFGKNIGTYNPFNAYVSMYAVNYRAEFAKAQLKELLIFVKKHDIDVMELKSSYAGAMTFAQFIPYSLNKWFVGEDIYDMNNNIMSVGNYLAYFKERTGSVDRAVYRYNPSELYTSAVLSLAEEAEKM